MKDTRTNYNNNTFVLLITFLSCLYPPPAKAEVSSFRDNYGPQENRPYNPVKFNYSEKTATKFTSLYGQLSKDVFDNNASQIKAEVNMEYAHLFTPSGNGYSGFGYLSAKMDNANKVRLNSSIGHFVEAIDGELFFSYRLFGDNLHYNLPSTRSIDDRVYENSFSAHYTRYSDRFLRETTLRYNFSTLPGEEFYNTDQPFQLNGTNKRSDLIGAYGNIMSHGIGAQVAFGYEELGSRMITGLRTSFELGYECVMQDELYSAADQTETSISLLAAIQHKTPFGLINTSYKHLDSSQTLYAGYSLEGIELYMKEIRYQDKKDNKLLGFLIKFDLLHLQDPFRKIKDLFKRDISNKRGQEQIRHSMSLKSDSLLYQPSLNSFIDS